MKKRRMIKPLILGLLLLLLGVTMFFNSCRKPEEDNPLISVSPTSLSFENSAVTKTVNISNTGTGKLTYSLSSTSGWIVITPSTGECTSETDQIVISINTSGLDYGNYDGTILVNSNGGQTQQISVSLVYTAPNTEPFADFVVNPQTGPINQLFSVDASATNDDNDPVATIKVRWQWEEGGNFTDWSTIKIATYTYSTSGTKKITLEAKDSKGLIGTTFRNVNVNANGAPNAEFIVDPETGNLTQEFSVDASASTDDIDQSGTLQVRWKWEEGGNFTSWSTIKTSVHTYSTSGTKTITLEVKDAMGTVGSTQRNAVVVPNNPPEVDFTYSPLNIYAGTMLTVTTTATDDNTPVGSLQYRFVWDASDSTSWLTNNIADHIYSTSGEKTITVRVRDANGGIGFAAKTLSILAVGLPSIGISAVSNIEITHNSAILRGNLSSLGNGSSEVTEYGFCWSKTSGPTVENSEFYNLGNSSHTGPFAWMAGSLDASSTYYAKAYAKNASGIVYSNQVSFITTIPVPDNAVETGLYSNLAATSAIVYGVIQNLGVGLTVQEIGFVWATSSNVYIDNGTPLVYGEIPTGVPYNYFMELNGLPSSTVVYFRAYMKTNAGYSYGQVRSFTTLATKNK